jgi:hypothetical protein
VPPETTQTATIATALFSVCWLFVLCFSIFSLREAHPRHVYGVWYSFSLAACISSVLFFSNPSFYWQTVSPSDGRLQRTAMFTLRSVTDTDNEVYFIVSALAILVLPQRFSYVLSGIFGCASPYRFI